MKAILENDMILAWSSAPSAVEVGLPPTGVGLERLRFDGAQIIDLATLATIHVVKNSGVFILHCVPVPGSQPVDMLYSQRRSLIDDNGIYRIKTVIEKEDDDKLKANNLLKANLRQELDKEIGDTPDVLADISKCLSLILAYLSGGIGAAEAKVVIDAIAPGYADIYPTDRAEATLLRNAAVLKERMAQYYMDYIV